MWLYQGNEKKKVKVVFLSAFYSLTDYMHACVIMKGLKTKPHQQKLSKRDFERKVPFGQRFMYLKYKDLCIWNIKWSYKTRGL